MAKKAKDKKNEPTSEGLQLWKVVGIFALVYAAVQLASGAISAGIQFVMDAVNASENVRVFLGNTIARAGMAAVAILITMPVIRSVFKKPGLPGLYPTADNKWKDVFIGMGIAAAAMTIIFLVEYALGFIEVIGFTQKGQPLDAWLRAAWMALLANAVAAIVGEVLFRGLLLQGIEITWDRWGALFISAIIFGASQIFAAGVRESNWLQYIPLLALPGVMLGWAFLRTENLWLACGINFAWNLVGNDLLNLTGTHNGDTLFGLQTTVTGPTWFVGKPYGFEVGAAGVLCVLLISAGVWWWTKRVRVH